MPKEFKKEGNSHLRPCGVDLSEGKARKYVHISVPVYLEIPPSLQTYTLFEVKVNTPLNVNA